MSFLKKIQSFQETSTSGIRHSFAALCILLFISILTMFSVNLKNSRLSAEPIVVKEDIKSLHEEKMILDKQLRALEEASSAPPAAEEVTAFVSEEIKEEKAEEEKNGLKVAVKDIRFDKHQDPDKFKVYFNVVKSGSGEERLKGYIILAGKTAMKSFTIPEGIDLSQGASSFFKRGERFSIKFMIPREKTIPYPIDRVETLDVFVFSREGKLLLKQNIWKHNAIL